MSQWNEAISICTYLKFVQLSVDFVCILCCISLLGQVWIDTELFISTGVVGELNTMTKGKKQHGHTQGQQGASSAATTSAATIHHTQINRTRSKLPTKRKKQRQDANFTAIPPPASIEEYELVISMPSNRPPRDNSNGAGRRRGGRGGLGHASRGHRNKGISFKN